MTCQHSRDRLTVEVFQCELCGRVEQRRVAQGCSPTPSMLIQQGLVDAESVIESMQLDSLDAKYLRSIVVCHHEHITESKCQASGKRLATCDNCGRKFSKVGE